MTSPEFLNRLANSFRKQAKWLDENGSPDVAIALRQEGDTADRAAAMVRFREMPVPQRRGEYQ